MKKIILIAVTGVILICCTLISVLATNAKDDTVDYNVYETQSSEKIFILGERGGRLVVFREGESEPFMETETLINTLPKSDRQRLEQGIEIRGEESLRKAMEDYCS